MTLDAAVNTSDLILKMRGFNQEQGTIEFF